MEAITTSDDEFYVEMRECLFEVFDTERDHPPVSFPEPVLDYRLATTAGSGDYDG